MLELLLDEFDAIGGEEAALLADDAEPPPRLILGLSNHFKFNKQRTRADQWYGNCNAETEKKRNPSDLREPQKGKQRQNEDDEVSEQCKAGDPKDERNAKGHIEREKE